MRKCLRGNRCCFFAGLTGGFRRCNVRLRSCFIFGGEKLRDKVKIQRQDSTATPRPRLKIEPGAPSDLVLFIIMLQSNYTKI